ELRQWWEKEQRGSKGEHGIQGVIKQVSEFGQYLGQEIVVGGEPDAILVLAELNDASGLRRSLEQQMGDLNTRSKRGPRLEIIDDPLAANLPAKSRTKNGDERDRLLVWIDGNLLGVSTELVTLRNLVATVRGNAAGRFAANPFYTRLAEVYREGAGFLIAADLEKMVCTSFKREKKTERADREAAALNQLGLMDLRYFIVEIKEKDGKPYNRAVVSFRENGHGITSWLAAPNPMGALEFISPDANIVAAFVVKE